MRTLRFIVALAGLIAALPACSAVLDFNQFTPGGDGHAGLGNDGASDGAAVVDLGGRRDRGIVELGLLREGGSEDGSFLLDGSPGACAPLVDSDQDTISDEQEGCTLARDSDHDKIPDYLDLDSDGDGLTDAQEAGDDILGTPPRDTDRDGYPDFRDLDSDNDGVSDAVEDRNHDGVVGCCRARCGEAIAGCPVVVKDACGAGQSCASSACSPPRALACALGESDPLQSDTFGFGSDRGLGSGICAPSSAENPNGLAPLQLSSSAPGDWTVALDAESRYTALALSNAKDREAAALIDRTDGVSELSGFVLSVPTSATTARGVATELTQQVMSKPPQNAAISVRASGTHGKSHDGFPRITLTTLEFVLTSPLRLDELRNSLLALLLARDSTTISNLPTATMATAKRFVLRFASVLRADGRAVLIGGVSNAADDANIGLDTRLHSMDLANGNALARAGRKLVPRCVSLALDPKAPKVDVIWVVDESGSMSDNRADIAKNANDLFAYAVEAGLDFRMGVTNVLAPSGTAKRALAGKFCSRISTDTADDGGVDRFLLPTEQTVFQACVNNPPGYEGGSEYGLVNAAESVLRHLPRRSNDPSRIRPDAEVFVIIVTDEVPNELSGLSGNDFSACFLDSAKQAMVDQELNPYISLLSGDLLPEAQATVQVIGGVCKNTCGAEVAHGYADLANARFGQVFDVCQETLGDSLGLIFDDLLASAAPLALTEIPVSASLKVALDGVAIPYNQFTGFRYSATHNAIWFSGRISYHKGSIVVASYARWE